MLRLTLIAFVLIPTVALAQGGEATTEPRLVEHWRCYSPSDFGKEKAIVEALRYEVPGKMAAPFQPGEIHVARQEYAALFVVEGFNRMWLFGPLESLESDKPQVFKFLINPDGAGYYYDFSTVGEGESTTPSQTFRCVEK